MANFYGCDFMFDDIPSQQFGLKIVNFDGGGVERGAGSSSVQILSQKVLRKAKPYYLGRTQEPVLEFKLSFASRDPLDGRDRDIISNWLFGRSEYKKLQIIQDDLNGAWFNCFLTDPSPVYIGNITYGFECTVVCDSPFAYSPLKTITETFTGDSIINHDLDLYNNSSDDDYLYPTIAFELNAIGNSFIIINGSDSDREFEFTDLQPSETITIDNDLQTVTSSTGLLRLSNFNKNWLRLLPKNNELTIVSGIGTYTITYYERLKIGG